MTEGISPLAVLSGMCLLGGGLLVSLGSFGLVRLPDFYSRTHAGGITDTLGATLVLVGLAFQAPDWISLVKLLMIMVFLFFTSPTSSHALVRAAFTMGLRPRLDNQDFDEQLLDGEAENQSHS